MQADSDIIETVLSFPLNVLKTVDPGPERAVCRPRSPHGNMPLITSKHSHLWPCLPSLTSKFLALFMSAEKSKWRQYKGCNLHGHGCVYERAHIQILLQLNKVPQKLHIFGIRGDFVLGFLSVVRVRGHGLQLSDPMGRCWGDVKQGKQEQRLHSQLSSVQRCSKLMTPRCLIKPNSVSVTHTLFLDCWFLFKKTGIPNPSTNAFFILKTHLP